MAAPHPGDFLEVMNRRSDLLRVLDDGKTKRELEGVLDVSRSTIDRGIRELEAKDLVERTADGYQQTLTGRLALRDYEGFTGRIEGLCEGSALLTELPPDVDLDPGFLEGADVVETARASPHRPIEELYQVVESADRVRGFAPAIHPQQVETYDRRITEEGMAAELVLTEGAIERLLSEYADAFERGLARDAVSVYRADTEFPYSLTVADVDQRTVAGLMVYGRSGIRGCVLNDSAPAVEWAVDRFETARARATAVQG